MNKFLQNLKKFKWSIAFSIIFIGAYLLLKFSLPTFAVTKLKQVVQQQTGFNLDVQAVELEPFGLEVNLSEISFSDKHFVKNLSIKVSITDILNKNIVVSKLNLSGIKAKILREKDHYSIENFTPTEKKVEEQKTEWKVIVKNFEISESEIKFNDGPIFKIEKLAITNIFSFDTLRETDISAKLGFKATKINIDGHISNYFSTPKGKINFQTQDFDLNNANYFLKNKIGKLEGILNTDTDINFSADEYKISTNLALNKFKLYSNDLKTIDYYIKDFKLKDTLIETNNKRTKVKAEKVIFENIILSIPKEKFITKKRFSQSSRIELKDLNFFIDHIINNNNKKMTLSSHYNDGGSIKVKKSQTEKGKVLDVDLKSIDLLPFSETFEAILGHQIESGKLDLKIDLTTVGSKTNGKAKAFLNQFKLDDQNESGDDLEASKSSMSLKTAIGLIRDDKGTIELEFDISGDENNPNFGFIPLLKKGIGSVVLTKLNTIVATKAATQFLPLLVSSIPFSPANAFLIVNGGYKFVTKPRFQDIEFVPKTDKITKETKDVVPKLKSFLIENESFNFVLCPVASIHEAKKEDTSPISKDKALALAQSRIQKVKQKISDTPSIHRQIVFCRPKVVEKKTEVGRIKISL